MPGGAPAAAEQPAEDAEVTGAEAATSPGLFKEASRIADEVIGPARMVASRRGGVRLEGQPPVDQSITDASDHLYEPPAPSWGEVAKSIIPGAGAQIRSAVANLKRLSNEDAIGERQQIIDSTPVAGPAVHPMVAKGVERQRTKLAEAIAKRAEIDQDAAAAMQDMDAATPKDMTTLQEAAFSAGTSGIPTLAGVAAGILTRNPAIAMSIAGGGGAAMQAGSTYGEAREKGATHEVAAKAAGIDALLEGAGESLPLKFALKPGSAFAKRLAQTLVAEAGQEGATQIMQDLNASLSYNPEITLAQAWHNFQVATLAGGMGGAGYAGIGAAADRGQEKPQPMHQEVQETTPVEPPAPPVVEPPAPVVEPPAPPAAPVEKAAGGAYSDLVPEPDGRIEPTGEIAPVATKEPETSAPPEPEPWEVPEEETSEPLTIADEQVRSELLRMVPEANWAEIGGKAIGAQTQHDVMRGGKTARDLRDEGIDATTKWVGKAEWAQELGMTKAEIEQAVSNALAGKRMGKRQKMAIEYMLEIANERIAYRKSIGEKAWKEAAEEIKAEGVDPTHEDVVDTDLVARATEIDESAVEDAARKYDNDDAAFMAEVRRIIGEHEAQNQNAGADGGRQEARGAPAQGEAAGGLQLETYTEAELAKRDAAAKEAAAKKKADEEAAERKRIADAQVDDFSLTGSDRTADVNPQQGGLNFHGMPRNTVEPEFISAAHDYPAPGLDKHPVRVTAHAIRTGDAAAIKRAAADMADLVPEGAALIPVPGSRGSTEANRQIAEIIAKKRKGTVHDILTGPVRARQYSAKKAGKPLTVEQIGTELRKAAKVPSNAVLIDNVVGTGNTIAAARKAIGSDVAAVVYAQDRKVVRAPKHLGAPAATAVAGAGAMPPASASSRVDKEHARPDAIRTAMRELFGAPINEKGVSKKYLGIYKIKPQTVRLQNRNDLRTASHEIGHHISNLNRPFRKVMRQHWDELVKIAPAAYLQQALQKFGTVQAVVADAEMRRFLVEEGFAEFIAEYLTKPATLRAKTPGFYAAFETWLGQNPKYAASLAQVAEMVGAHQALAPADKILAKVGVFKPTVRERAAALVDADAWNAYTQQALDKWHPLKLMVADLAPGLAASKNPYIAARLLPGDAAVVEDWVSNFTSPFDYTKRLDAKNYGKPLKEVLAPVMKGGEEQINNFKAYLIARRAAELMKVGKENLLTKDEIAAGLKLETPVFKQVAKDVYAYNDRLLDYAVEGGLLSPETAAKFREYANYIPFFREPDGDAKTGAKGNPFKRLTGGTQNLRDPIANLIQNTANIVYATNRNAMVAKAAELAESVPGGGRWLERVKVPMEAHNIATDRIIEELEKQGVQVDRTMASGMAAMQTFFTPSGKGADRARIIVYKAAGELKAMQVNDPVLWQAMSNLPPLEMGLILKVLAFPARTLRAGVVLDPTFMVRNFVRDTLSATIQSKGNFLPVVSTAAGIKAQAQMSDAFKLWRSFGGSSSSQFQEPEQAARAIQRMAKRGNFDPVSIISPARLLNALEHIGSFTEYGSRIGEFKATYKPGDFESALQAAFNSREVSTDFGMRGGNTTLQVWTRLVPFMNPAMQGLYKTARVLSGADGKGTAAKAAMLGTAMALASIMLALSNSGEEWYDKIEEWEKATYWHFKLGGQVWRIPKPFEYGMFFASIPEAIALYGTAKESIDDFRKRMLQVLSQVSIRAVPQIAVALAEPWANKSFFTGRKIVPDRQERLEPRLQSNPQTSKVAQAAGEATNVSPALIDNAVRNVFGTLGVHAETVADLLLAQTGTFPPARERSWQSWPAIKAFVRDPDNPNTKQQRDFYQALEQYRTAVATVKELKARGEETKAEAYSEEKADELSMAHHAEQAAKRLSKLRKQINSIQWDRDMTPAEKREAINDHNAEMQDIAVEQTSLYQAAKKSYARSGSQGGQ